MIPVEYKETPQDVNHNIRHLICDDLKMFAYPYQDYYGRIGNYHVIFGDLSMSRGWSARVAVCFPDGYAETVAFAHFPQGERDWAVQWARARIKHCEEPPTMWKRDDIVPSPVGARLILVHRTANPITAEPFEAVREDDVWKYTVGVNNWFESDEGIERAYMPPSPDNVHIIKKNREKRKL